METKDKRNEILKAASSCFSRYGYEKTTLDDIGKLVGLNKASLYYYFKNKEDICTEVVYKEANDFKSGIIDELSKVSGYKEKIITYLTGRLNFIRGASYLNQLSNDSLQSIAPFFNKMYSKLLLEESNTLAAILDSGIQQGEITPCDTVHVAKSILTVSEAIRSRIDCCLATDEALKETSDEIQFTVSLILDGLADKH
jgi:AcrR family transcriptional regulator